MISLDNFDLALLAALQRDGRATHQQLSEQVHLSASQVGRRLARLESEGVIEGYRVVLSPTGLGLGVTFHGLHEVPDFFLGADKSLCQKLVVGGFHGDFADLQILSQGPLGGQFVSGRQDT